MTSARATYPQVYPWPEPPGCDAFYGLAGEMVRVISPETEADPVGLLVQLLTMMGNVVGRKPHATVGATRHPLILFSVLVGPTGKGRKGSSWDFIKSIGEAVDPEWARSRIKKGLSSGEGLIHAVRDRSDGGYEVEDKRLLVVESEFASSLRIADRDGNILSTTLRDAWDGANLQTLSKNSPEVATAPHISIAGHVTGEELRRYITRTEAANGYANRHLWICVKRSKTLPDGGRYPEDALTPLIDRLRGVKDWVEGPEEIVFSRDADARDLWWDVYEGLSDGKPGLLGAIIGRAEAQVLRLSCIYALLDQSALVRVEHLRAALATWHYAEDSARHIFGDATGEPDADKIHTALTQAGPTGLSRSDIYGLFGNNADKEKIDSMLGRLESQGFAKCERVASGGRPAEIWFATILSHA